MPQIYDMGPTALLPLRRKACWGCFFALNIRRLRPGLNPRTWVLKASTLPLDHRSRCSWDTWKNVVWLDRPQITKWRTRIACWLPKAINTYSEYVILIAFPLQQWLRERASMLRYTYIICPFFNLLSPCMRLGLSKERFTWTSQAVRSSETSTKFSQTKRCHIYCSLFTVWRLTTHIWVVPHR